jgi:CDP-diacylglycerol--glycerol-3-phosphate 3-phosphatidyltransferase
MLIAVGLAVWYGTLPLWFLPFGLARYAYILSVWLFKRMEREPAELPASVSRRPIAGLSMGFLTVMLWPIVGPPETTLAALIFILPFLASFGRDWLVVLGILDPHSALYVNLRSCLKSLLLGYVPLILRPAALISILPSTLNKLAMFEAQVHLYAGNGYPQPRLVVALFAVIEALSLALITLGIAGRSAALLLVVPVGLTIVGFDLNLPRTIALACVLGILILGTGRFSLWRPEEAIFGRHAGGAR